MAKKKENYAVLYAYAITERDELVAAILDDGGNPQLAIDLARVIRGLSSTTILKQKGGR